jgi:DNA-binding response OmpR family regulator
VRLAIIEDDKNVAMVLAEALLLEGHEVVVAHTGEDGLTELRRQRPDAVFLDLRLPGASGVEVLRSIRETDPDLPVIIITGYPDDQAASEVIRLGVTDIVTKPHILTEFSRALERARSMRKGPAAT